MSMRNKFRFIFPVAAALTLFGCMEPVSDIDNDRLKLLGGEPVVYLCDNGDQIVTRYYSLSDDTLNFVKLTLPDGKKHTLPHTFSASGSRYTDGYRVVWWAKGDSGFTEVLDQNGEWKIKYRNCKKSSEVK